MPASSILRTLIAAACLGAAPAAWAVTLTFGTPLAGTGPTTSFATLAYDPTIDGSGDDWTFTLTAGNLSSIFAATGAFIGSIAVSAPGFDPQGPFSAQMTNVSGGVSGVTAGKGGGPQGEFDFRFDLIGAMNDKLASNESVQWTWSDSGFTSFTQFALHVQGLGKYNSKGYSSSIWYSPTTPVPEPQTYAMLVAGLGAIGVFVRRRRR